MAAFFISIPNNHSVALRRTIVTFQIKISNDINPKLPPPPLLVGATTLTVRVTAIAALPAVSDTL